MRTSFRRIYTDDNLELTGLLYEPNVTAKSVLVHVHGMAGNFYENKFLDHIAKALTDAGIAFFTFNNRGCEFQKDLYKIIDGKRTIVRIGNAFEIFEDSLLDIKAAIDFAASNGFSRIHLSGHSLGAPKVAHYAAVGGDSRLSSVIFLSPSDMVGLVAMDEHYERDSDMARKMVAEGRGGDLLPFPVLWDQTPLSARTYLSLRSRDSKVAIFNFHDPEDTLPVLAKITTPVLAVMGRKDDALVIPVEDTMERIRKASYNSPKVETKVLGEADHGYSEHGEQLADEICHWVHSLV